MSSDRAPLNAVVVIPAYQAQAGIRSLVQSVKALNLPVIVVDDASSDRTGAEAEAAGAEVLTRSVNAGKGAALREGIAAALARRFNWVLTMDADGQHLPEEIPRFLEAAGKDQADLIIGNRMGNPEGMPLKRRWTNRFMSWLLSRMLGVPVPDTQCGFRIISSRLLEGVDLASSRFEIDSELVVKSVRAGFRVASIPVSSVYRSDFSFIRPVRDTIRFIRFLRSVR
ncbi:MAG: glycosyltransferase family 2 protein [Candidatus Omnitrophica bacterium]|nr:glycosyltransferase family 2 protein [Candidatus Omnitrophota bacterium]